MWTEVLLQIAQSLCNKRSEGGTHTVFSGISFAGFRRSQAFSRLKHVRDHAIKTFRSIYLETTFALGTFRADSRASDDDISQRCYDNCPHI